MAAPAIGTVVLVRFPFSDLSSSKLRPAAVLADVGRGDYVLCQITSNSYADPNAIELRDEHFSQGAEAVTAQLAQEHAESEFEKYRRMKDRLFESDFDRVVKELPESRQKEGE